MDLCTEHKKSQRFSEIASLCHEYSIAGIPMSLWQDALTQVAVDKIISPRHENISMHPVFAWNGISQIIKQFNIFFFFGSMTSSFRIAFMAHPIISVTMHSTVCMYIFAKEKENRKKETSTHSLMNLVLMHCNGFCGFLLFQDTQRTFQNAVNEIWRRTAAFWALSISWGVCMAWHIDTVVNLLEPLCFLNYVIPLT